MYGIAVSTIACLRGGTRVDVVWNLDPALTPAFDPADALAFTPGGGRLGSLLDGALDGQLAELAGVERTRGRIVELTPGPAESARLGVNAGTSIRCLLTPATELPEELWPLLLERAPVALVARLDRDEVARIDVYNEATIDDAGDEVARRFRQGQSDTSVDATTAVTVLRPRPTLVVFGGGDIATAIGDVASYLGWAIMAGGNAGDVSGLTATLSSLDGVVVLGHDSESTGRVLEAALSGGVGYIGSIGPRPVREARDEWLAYRGLTDLERVNSPAGLDIGARNPKEIALAVVAEMIARQTHQSS